ncbi:hypothetical protein O0L34_g18413 [Tuta absoluta]|nr:hypothetical protein O0L34_g18413 [Tuta absoluta]
MSRVVRSPPPESPAAPFDPNGTNQHEESYTDYVNQDRNDKRQIGAYNERLNKLESLIKSATDNQSTILKKLATDMKELKIQNSKIQETNIAINTTLNFLSDQYELLRKKTETLENERKEHLNQIAQLEAKVEDLQRYNKAAAIEIRNMPMAKTESKDDLIKIVQKTYKAIGVETKFEDIKDTYRISTKTVKNAIITEFTRNILKNTIIQKVKQYNKQNPNSNLSSRVIGVSGADVPIYISEALTNKARRLLYLARDVRKSCNYKYCWTSNGRVFLRKTDDAPHIEIKDENQITSLRKQI